MLDDGWDMSRVLTRSNGSHLPDAFPLMPVADIDLFRLRRYLRDTKPTGALAMSAWAKLVCLYDLIRWSTDAGT